MYDMRRQKKGQYDKDAQVPPRCPFRCFGISYCPLFLSLVTFKVYGVPRQIRTLLSA
jgi:hypothetical protein